MSGEDPRAALVLSARMLQLSGLGCHDSMEAACGTAALTQHAKVVKNPWLRWCNLPRCCNCQGWAVLGDHMQALRPQASGLRSQVSCLT